MRTLVALRLSGAFAGAFLLTWPAPEPARAQTGPSWFLELFAPRRVVPPPPPPSSAPSTPRRAAPARPAPGTPPEEPEKSSLPATGATPPYETELMRLSEIVGALHYLRPLCGAPEGTRWRAEMQALVEAEALSEDRRDRLTRSFNRGYYAFERTYRSCTPAATLAIDRYLDEGSKLARDIVARFGN